MLEVEQLQIGFDGRLAVRSVTLSLNRGDRIGLAGESGCGKSLSALALMGMTPPSADVKGSIKLNGRDMTGATEADWRRHRPRDIAMIFQDPMSALNPLKRIGDLVGEPLRVHRGLGPNAARSRTLSLLEEVGLPEPKRRIDQYPHQLSGGQRQRVMIAAALACDPAILIADEPTTALDASIAAQVIELINTLVSKRNMALLLISHDLDILARATKQLIIMYGGDMVERGNTETVLKSPVHPYTQGLLAARPQINAAIKPDGTRPRLASIPGAVPPLEQMPQGCRFAGRCPVEQEKCAANLPLMHRLSEDHAAYCHFADQPERLIQPDRSAESAAVHPGLVQDAVSNAGTVVVVDGVNRHYRLPRRHVFSAAPRLSALNTVSLTLEAGESLGIVGESGSGKSTLARLIMGFEKPDGGQIRLFGDNFNALSKAEQNRLRPQFQMVFQDPFASLDPRRKVGWSVGEPLLQERRLDEDLRRRRVLDVLDQVGLKAADAQKYPHEFSGGQRQRIAIARAIVTRPKVLIADEPVSALDVSVQAQILNLIMDMQEAYGLSVVFISHDLAVVASLCDRLLVLYRGQVVETGKTQQILQSPQHDYTKKLLADRHHTRHAI